ncbi:ATP-binding response regulator [Natronorubrum halophilum]|uniref:ATP-binding response regulator n=1 Tax=Natronorubrum halophilum TaxID=1702106 RepID=UPI00148501A2|nr:hybrid sensor histidine kinase/response regulator [Natronorubrum halophilum]
MTTGQPDPYTVLLVEDDDLQARLYQMMLSQNIGNQRNGTHGGRSSKSVPTVEIAETLADAQDVLRDASTSIDLVLLDLNLSDSSGLDTLDSVLETVDKTAVVVLTAMDDAMIGREAVERGAQDYLLKDHVTPRLLVQTVTYAIERRKRAAELERQRRELAVLHWLVRHEIREDAVIVLGWGAELSPSDPDEKRTISRIVDAGEHIVELTESVGAMVQTLDERRPELTAIDLEGVLAEEIERLKARYDDVEVTFDRTGETVSVKADRFLNVVVRNVLTNAVVYTEGQDGEVTVSVIDEDGDEPSTGFSVSDDGSGVSLADHQRITDREYTPEGARSGVGLYLVQTFVDRYGGRLEIEEESGQEAGTTVRVSLEPAADTA